MEPTVEPNGQSNGGASVLPSVPDGEAVRVDNPGGVQSLPAEGRAKGQFGAGQQTAWVCGCGKKRPLRTQECEECRWRRPAPPSEEPEKEEPEEAVEEWGDDADVPQVLRDMRHVYSRPESSDKTEGQRTMRAWKRDKPATFMEAMERREAEYAGKSNQQSSLGEGERDLGTERCRELIRQLLDKAKAGAGAPATPAGAVL
jgi:hypothetical protein